MLRSFHILLSFHPDLSDRCIFRINSFSKPWAMTGWRLGLGCHSDELATDIERSTPSQCLLFFPFLQPLSLYALSYDVTPMGTKLSKAQWQIVFLRFKI